MSENTAIEWTDATWNPTVGCSLVSPGCTNCYAMRVAWRLHHAEKYAGLTRLVNGNAVWTGAVRLDESALAQPLRWKQPRRIFVNSMSDLFHEVLPDAAIDKVFAVMALCPQHTFQVLTKRAERMRRYMSAEISTSGGPMHAAHRRAVNLWGPSGDGGKLIRWGVKPPRRFVWPPENVWLGVSVEDQERADERIPLLVETPAAVRFLSCEPLLGPVDIVEFRRACNMDWIIVGGESGPNARDMNPNWARSLLDQCTCARVPFFMKQMARRAPIPADLLVREFPGMA